MTIKKGAKKPREMVTIVLTADEALDASIALALSDYIHPTRFKGAHKISGKILRAIIKQVPQIEEASDD